MLLTERQIRELIRAELRGGDSVQKLNEFKAIFGALTDMFKQLGGVMSTNFSGAVSAYKNANKSEYVSTKKGASKDKLNTKTDAYDQVFALGEVLWHIDTAIDLAITSLERSVGYLDMLEIPVEPGDTEFTANLNSAAEAAAESLGYFSGYVSKAPSSKVSDIGSSLESGESLTDTLKNFAAGVSTVEGLNPLSDWEKIIGSDAVKNVLEKNDDNSENMKNLINSIKGNNISNIGRIGDLKSLIDQANVKAIEAEQVMDFAAEEEGEKPESSDLLDHYKVLRPIIREVFRNGP